MSTCYSSSSSVVGQIPPQHQVFINFRGQQLRRGFVSFLVPALRNENINVFIDETEIRGRDLQDLFKRIEESSVAVVIFSECYTESKWCLNELVKIKERMIEGKLKVIPVFYKVTVDDVKQLEGKFGINFRKTKRGHRGGLYGIRKWEKALNYFPKRFGLPSLDYRFVRFLPLIY
ncbi:Toll/interleukin-1 receptor homology (TIR) domain [Arabidopsis suecica]|uniref:Toll/interleukin-1 receptor homology (TIR) domain n=1 Tax=Arabidopsis suecica TaxID=45249 RepID=A0A8T1YKW7_ARASU|nr:Toll/interleukin-1 receptor homology (TIR) domain [Arabidopsis suecica]